MWGLRAAASFLTLAAAALPFAAPVWAQQLPDGQAAAVSVPFQSPVLTINQQRLFEDSAFGKASLTRLEAASRELQAEIRKIESDLEIEERMLTERRAELQPSEFQPLSRAFDDKVEKIREAWSVKDRELKRQRDADQQTFFESAVPLLAELMREMGAVVLIDQSSVILSLDRVDVTQVAIDRLDAVFNAPKAPEVGADPAATAPDAETAPVDGGSAPNTP